MRGDDARVVLAIGARLHMSAAAVERLSRREIVAWLDFFTPQAAAGGDEALDVRALGRDALKAMFHHARR